MQDEREGWGWPLEAKTAHYFVDGRSLCGKWMFTGELMVGAGGKPYPDHHSSNCKTCQRKRRPASLEEKIDHLRADLILLRKERDALRQRLADINELCQQDDGITPPSGRWEKIKALAGEE